MVYNEEQKQAHYRWRQSHPEQYKGYVLKSALKHYQEHKVEKQKYARDRYTMKKIFAEFRNILFEN